MNQAITGNIPKILVIEDNEDIITMIKLMLEMKGYQACIKMNAHNAEHFIKELMPDLIIMDMLLSGGDGREICKSLKGNPEFSHIPVFMISAHPNARRECLQAGADFYLSKPFDMHEFFHTIEKALLF